MVQTASIENKATTNAYASILKVNCFEHPNVSVVIRNSHATYVADYKILVSNEVNPDLTWAADKAEAQLAGNNATAKYALNGAYKWVDVQAKANSAGSQALLWIYLYATQKGGN
jgi:hypothetical protein